MCKPARQQAHQCARRSAVAPAQCRRHSHPHRSRTTTAAVRGEVARCKVHNAEQREFECHRCTQNGSPLARLPCTHCGAASASASTASSASCSAMCEPRAFPLHRVVTACGGRVRACALIRPVALRRKSTVAIPRRST
eukprot:790165-Prymnesium_polylepis.1